MTQKSKILITGGSGFIGSHFAEALGESVELLNADLRLPPEGNCMTNTQLVDVRNANALRLLFTNHKFDAIIHLAAAHKDFGIEQEEYFTTNVEGTSNITKLAAEFAVNNIIFFSSVAVYGDRHEPTSDDTLPLPTNDYGRSKLEAEQILQKWCDDDIAARKLLIVRPALVYGERNVANMYRLIDQIAKGRYFNVGAGENIKSIAYVKNLVEATWYLFTKLPEGKFVCNYSDEPHLKTAEIGSIIARELGKRKPLSIPKGLLLLMAKPFDMLIKLTGKDLPISSVRVKKFGTQTFHQAALVFKVGFTPKYSTSEGLIKMVNWYKINQNSKNVSQTA